MKITENDIRNKTEKKKQEERNDFQEYQQRTKELILEQLAKNDYRGVLEAVYRAGIDIPRDYFEKAADFHNRTSRSAEDLMLARRAYRDLNLNDKVKALDDVIKRWQEREDRRDFLETYLD